MVAMPRDNDELRLTAYCDGELDLVSATEFERRLAADEYLRTRYSRLTALQRAVRSLPMAAEPPDLQARIQARLNTEQANTERTNKVSNVAVLRRPSRNWSFRALAASAVFGAVISGSVLTTISRYGQVDGVASEVVAGHIRRGVGP